MDRLGHWSERHRARKSNTVWKPDWLLFDTEAVIPCTDISRMSIPDVDITVADVLDCYQGVRAEIGVTVPPAKEPLDTGIRTSSRRWMATI